MKTMNCKFCHKEFKLDSPTNSDFILCHNCCGKFNYHYFYKNNSLIREAIIYKDMTLEFNYETGKTEFTSKNGKMENFPGIFTGITKDNLVDKLNLYNLIGSIPPIPYDPNKNFQTQLEEWLSTIN